MRTLIIGAGVAGMTLASLLRRRGQSPVVVERADSIDGAGYMLGLYPMGGRVLRAVELYDGYRERGVAMKRYRIGDGCGRIIQDYDLSEVTERFGPILGIRRGDLLDVIRSGSDGLEIRFGTTISSLDQDAGAVEVAFSDGSDDRFDLVVGADGLHSHTRDLILEESEYRYGETGWGGWVEWVDKGLGPLDTYTEYWGAGTFLGLYPTPDQIGMFVGGPTTSLSRDDPGVFYERMLDSLGDEVPALREAPAPTADAFFWDFHDCRADRWANGRVILLGDSAAGFLPTAGVGASMAMESAAVLDDVLSRASTDRVPSALMRYEKRHRARVEAAQDSSRRMSRLMFVSSSPLAWARDRLVGRYSLEQLVSQVATMMNEPI